jgi:hypothetical protein
MLQVHFGILFFIPVKIIFDYGCKILNLLFASLCIFIQKRLSASAMGL